MQITIKNIITKFLIILISIQILNLSVDSIDFQPISDNIVIGDFNYLNSFTEYVSEILLGHKDSFPEYQNESTSSKAQFVKHLSLKLYQSTSSLAINKYFEEASAFIVQLKEPYSFIFCKEINPPPPKVSCI